MAISLQAQVPLKTEVTASSAASPLPALLEKLDAAAPQTVQATVVAAPPATPNADEVALAKAQATIQEKDALIERLSEHLESALARLNQTTSPVVSANTSVAALGAIKARLEEQNNILKAKQEELQAKLDESSKKSQLLDLENRQLFEALNGRPYQDKSVSHTAADDSVPASTHHFAKDE